jgi:putative ABC transport system permease protein
MTLMQDAAYAVRGLRKSPAFSVVALVTLALGIGANAAIFHAVYGMLLRPLAYRDAERLVFVWSSRPTVPREPLSPARLIDFRQQLTSLHGVAGISQIPLNLTGNGEAERLDASSVSSNFFDILGVAPLLGETFHDGAADDRAVVLSYGLWLTRFGGDRGIVGRQITLNGSTRIVVAVMPKEFDWPMITAGPNSLNGPQLWIPGARGDVPRTPTDRADQDMSSNRDAEYVRAVARLKEDTTVAQAQREVEVIAARIGQTHPDTDGGRGAAIVPLRTQFYGHLRQPLLVLVGAVILVLAIACANVASLLLGRASARRKEIAVRLALGAGRGRIVRQFLIESIVLATGGGLCGLLVAWWAQSALIGSNPAGIVRIESAPIDPIVILFTVALTLLTGLLSGLMPALQSSRHGIVEDLQDGGARSSSGPRSNRNREALAVIQLAVALTLVVGAILLLRSFSALRHVDTGINTQNLLTFNIFLGGSRAQSPEQQAAFYDEALDAIRRLPDVNAAGAAVTLPIGGDDFSAGYVAEGRPLPPPGQRSSAGYQVVTPGYFAAMGIPVLAGRDFTPADHRTAMPVVIVNRTFASIEWPGRDPIGRRIRTSDDGPWMTVVGVVGDVRHRGPSVAPRPEFYQPHTQRSFSFMAFVVRTRHDPVQSVPLIRAEISRLDPLQPVSRVATMDEHLARALSRPRLMFTLVAAFGVLALTLSVVGIYGVMAYFVTQRTREIAIRMALGAPAATVVAMIVSRTALLAAIGVAAGLGGAAVFARALSGLLFGIGSLDATTFLVSAALLAGTCLAAGAIPALRATRIDGVEALKG